jgi:hypothetical protein
VNEYDGTAQKMHKTIKMILNMTDERFDQQNIGKRHSSKNS